MRERPIIANGSMVRALLEGRQTQKRSVVWPQPVGQLITCGDAEWFVDAKAGLWRCPFGQPGDRLWVRETWSDPTGDRQPVYRADLTPRQEAESVRVNRICRGMKGIAMPWRPSIHMPRWASRLALEVTEVRVQRLKDITWDDAKAEGWPPRDFAAIPREGPGPFEWFSATWDSIYGARPARLRRPFRRDAQRLLREGVRRVMHGEPIRSPLAWEANPWVWAVSFRRVTP